MRHLNVSYWEGIGVAFLMSMRQVESTCSVVGERVECMSSRNALCPSAWPPFMLGGGSFLR